MTSQRHYLLARALIVVGVVSFYIHQSDAVGELRRTLHDAKIIVVGGDVITTSHRYGTYRAFEGHSFHGFRCGHGIVGVAALLNRSRKHRPCEISDES